MRCVIGLKINFSVTKEVKFVFCVTSFIGCPSVFGEKAGHVPIVALKKRARPKFRTFSKEKSLKKRDIKDFRRDIHQKSENVYINVKFIFTNL